MYFIFQLEFNSTKTYIADLIRAYAKKMGIELDVFQDSKNITISAKQDDEQLEAFLKGLEEVLPASIFLGKSTHFFREEKLVLQSLESAMLPLNIAPCPTCQKEMFDVSSRRYYYPFTSCNHCGSQHSFLDHYPYSRANSSMKFLAPCEACEAERKGNTLRLDYPLISCIECGIGLRMVDKESEHRAVDKGSYRKLFEVSGRAIASGKTVLMKTLHGYRKFFKPTQDNVKNSTLLMASANGFNTHLMMVQQEFNALLSIERPLLRVATKSDALKALYGSSTLVKFPDDGMTMLLGREILNSGLEYIAYTECDSSEEVDFLVDFDLPTSSQKDIKLFINQDKKLFVSGERVVFPISVKSRRGVVSLAHNLLGVEVEGKTIIDNMEKFEKITGSQVNILESEDFESGQTNEKRFPQYKASMMSVLAEHHKIGEKAVGVHFDGNLNFLYYNGKEIINAVPPIPFESDNLWKKISTLREGSDRLVQNYKKAYPQVWERLDSLKGDKDIFEVTAITLGLEDESFEGISAEALSFLGKGGLQIDTRVEDNRFDNYAFLTSIMSYQLGDVESNYLCYSIYESFGDYIGEIIPQLIEKVKTRTVILTGETFANQSLYGRIERTLGIYKPLMSKSLPIGKECGVYGGLFF